MRKSAIIIIMQTVLIIGASSGIGYACAKKFIAEGYEVLALSRTECVLAGVKNYLCDVSIESDLEKTLNVVLSENPLIKHLIYSAGFSMAAPLETVEPQDYRYLFEVNFFGFVHCLRRLIPSLRHSGGSACVISSVGGVSPIPYDSYYSSSKAALNAFCAALQTELRPKGVRVLSVMPGGTKTNFSFKRKIYPKEKTGDYSVAVKTASDKLQKIEQQGMSADTVAEEVFNKCVTPSAFYLFATGLKNKLVCLLVRFLPQPLSVLLTRAVFLANPDLSER